MILKIIVSFAAAFGLYWTIKYKKLFPAIITLGMIAGIAVVFIPTRTTTGLYIYMVFVALAFVYGLIIKGKSIGERIIICLMAASVFAYWLWVLNHWHGNTLFFPIITLLTGAAGVFSKAKLKNELGFLLILFVDAIAILLEHWMKAMG
jgi:multisubunit Na+/H+ antiporter MnhF subunit